MTKTVKTDNLLEAKREYRDLLYDELKSKGYSSSEANFIIDKSDFISLMEKYPKEVFHESVTNMADDMIRKVFRMSY